MRTGAEATEGEASGRKSAWEGRETVTWCPGQVGQMALSRSPCRGEAGRGGAPEAEVCGAGGSAGHLREASGHEDRKDTRHSGSQMPCALGRRLVKGRGVGGRQGREQEAGRLHLLV